MMGSYRIGNTEGIGLLDACALRGWRRSDLEVLASRVHLVVPESVFTEILTSNDVDRADGIFYKLQGLHFECTDRLGRHFQWELEHQEPAGLLLDDTACRGLPAKAAQRAVEWIRQELVDKAESRRTIERFITKHDRPDEEFWERINREAIRVASGNPLIRPVRTSGKKEFLRTLICSRAEIDATLRLSFTDFLAGIQTGSPSLDLEVLGRLARVSYLRR